VTWRRFLVVAVCLAPAVRSATAQVPVPPPRQPPVIEDPECYYYGRCPAVWWGEELAVVGGNVLLGALTAGLWQELGGGSFKDGFTRGALGGAVIYAGKRIASGRFPVAGLLGREVAAVGHSVVRNAGEGRGTLDRVALPLGFLPAQVQLGSWGKDARVRVDVLALWNLGYGLIEPKLELDWSRSLTWGAAVFTSRGYDFVVDDARASAMAAVGTIYLNGDLVAFPGFERVGAHERVHVLQGDAIISWGDAADDWLEAQVPPLQWVSRYVTPRLFSLGFFALGRLVESQVEYSHRPGELEARALAGQDP